MTEFKRVASYISYGRQETGIAEVHRTQGVSGNETFIATNGNGKPDAELLGAICTGVATPETHIIADPSVGSHLAARAILLNAAYQGNTEVKTLVTTVLRSDSAKLDDYDTLGFKMIGSTRDKDKRGRELPPEEILISHSGSRRATVELGRRSIVRSQVTTQATRWDDAYDR